MKKLNEKEIIKIFQNSLGNKKFVCEDVEVFKLGRSLCVMKLDTLVESTDIPQTMKLFDAARKSVVACISDFAAKGVIPRYCIISVTLPRKFLQKKIKQLASGLSHASKEFNFQILGGDTNEGKELVIQVSLFGSAKKIVPRKGAKTGDIIITSGPFGYPSAGLKIIIDKKRSNKKFSSKARKLVFKPKPRLRFGVINRNYFSSSMDSSDGLSSTLHEMSKQSKKKFVITLLPVNPDLIEFAKMNRLDPFELILNGGEEYEIVATVNPSNLMRVKRNAKSLKIPLFEIGHVTNGRGVVYKSENKTMEIKNSGLLHFGS